MSTLKIKRENGKIFCPLVDSWHIETPEEKVRQEYIKILVEDYGYSLDQMAQEIKVNNSQRGQGKARADIVIWKSKQDKIESKAAFIVVECKAENSLSEKEQVVINERIEAMQSTLNKELDTQVEGSRMYNLSRNCIYGTDANPRMARTSKMNMIMHGDGHGGVHHHDGLLNVNGIFEERFDVILTNPPFGARIDKSQKITEADIQLSVHRKEVCGSMCYCKKDRRRTQKSRCR